MTSPDHSTPERYDRSAVTDTNRAIDAVWRIESARLIAGLTRIVRDVGVAEELAQDALIIALEKWPETGVPDNPGAWLMATAKHRAIDQLRREVETEALAQQAAVAVGDDEAIADRCAAHSRSDHNRVPRGLGAGIAHGDYTIFPILLDRTDLASPRSSLLGSPGAPRLRPAFRDTADPQRAESTTYGLQVVDVCFASNFVVADYKM